jgi:hypothetical protein
MWIHPKGRRFIYRNRVRLARHRNIISGNVAARAEKGDVDFVERSITQFLHGDRFFAKTNGLSHRTLRANQTQARHRKISAFQNAQQFCARGTGRAHDSDVITFQLHTDFIAAFELCKATRNNLSSKRWRQ